MGNGWRNPSPAPTWVQRGDEMNVKYIEVNDGFEFSACKYAGTTPANLKHLVEVTARDAAAELGVDLEDLVDVIRINDIGTTLTRVHGFWSDPTMNSRQQRVVVIYYNSWPGICERESVIEVTRHEVYHAWEWYTKQSTVYDELQAGDFGRGGVVDDYQSWDHLPQLR